MFGFNLIKNECIVSFFKSHSLFDFKCHFIEHRNDRCLIILGGFFLAENHSQKDKFSNGIIWYNFTTREWVVSDGEMIGLFEPDGTKYIYDIFDTVALEKFIMIAKKPFYHDYNDKTQHDYTRTLFKLHLLRPIEWDVERIIWLAYHKNATNVNCKLSILPKDLIRSILAMCQWSLLDDFDCF